MTSRNCSCNTTGGWTRVANIDMTDPSQPLAGVSHVNVSHVNECPDGFRLVTRTTAPLRTCGRPGPAGCVSTTFPVNGIEYSQVCGRVIGYQFGTPDAINVGLTIDQNYVDGVSLTHGQSPRQHIWTFAAVRYEIVVPAFIGQDYFCETGNRDSYQYIFFPDDPLWNGQGCGADSTCCSFNNPPWFCKQLPQPTTDDIELRLCGDEDTNNEDTPLEMAEIYIK